MSVRDRFQFQRRAVVEAVAWISDLQRGWQALAAFVLIGGFVLPTSVKGASWWVGLLVLGALAFIAYAEGMYRAWGPEQDVRVSPQPGQVTGAVQPTIVTQDGGQTTVNIHIPPPESEPPD